MTWSAHHERAVRQLSFIMSNKGGEGGERMATDVVPVLNERIQTDFKNNVMKDRRIRQISQRIRDGTATFVDGHDYAERLGENLSKALVTNLTADTLPDGRLYYNIAKRTVTPALEENYNLTNEIAADIQKIMDEAAGIGLNAVKAAFPAERIQGLIDKMTADGITLERALVWLTEPIINNSEAFFDDFIDLNARFRENVGLKATITRSVAPGCCEWCDKMAGTFDYRDKPDDIFRRHEFCRCTVTYQSNKTSQNVWSKRTWKSSSEEIARRQQIGQRPQMTPTELIQQADQLFKDKVASQINESRYLALRRVNKMSPEQRLEKLKEYEEKRTSRR